MDKLYLQQQLIKQQEVFHVHTKRCKHASQENEELYIQKAVKLGAKKISFTDHAPFPENPFGNRMRIEELDDYIEELLRLQDKYKELIQVSIGLEVEYLPGYLDYYRKLKSKKELDMLILGQHFYEDENGMYSFAYSPEQKKLEAAGLCEATIQGIQSGFFNTVAHPDRIFRRCQKWTEEMTDMSRRIIAAAVKENVQLEHNIASIKRNQYRDEFWKLVPENAKTIVGFDAHAVKELENVIM